MDRARGGGYAKSGGEDSACADGTHVTLLAEELQRLYERRCKFSRMDAVDADEPRSQPREAHPNSTNTAQAPNDAGKPATVPIVTHKPPPYPVNGYHRNQSLDDDLFSSCFEDAIGDNIVEDTELEWDHSPDTDASRKPECLDPDLEAEQDIIFTDIDTNCIDIELGGLEDIDRSESPMGSNMDSMSTKKREMSPPPPPPAPMYPPPLIHDENLPHSKSTDVDNEPLPPPPPPPPELANDPNLDDSGGQSVISYSSVPSDVSLPAEVLSMQSEPEDWPAPPVEIEVAPAQESVARIEYKTVVSPVRLTFKEKSPPPKKPPRSSEHGTSVDGPEIHCKTSPKPETRDTSQTADTANTNPKPDSVKSIQKVAGPETAKKPDTVKDKPKTVNTSQKLDSTKLSRKIDIIESSKKAEAKISDKTSETKHTNKKPENTPSKKPGSLLNVIKRKLTDSSPMKKSSSKDSIDSKLSKSDSSDRVHVDAHVVIQPKPAEKPQVRNSILRKKEKKEKSEPEHALPDPTAEDADTLNTSFVESSFVSIHIKNGHPVKQRHSFQPEPEPKPVLSSFGRGSLYSTLPRKYKYEKKQKPDIGNVAFDLIDSNQNMINKAEVSNDSGSIGGTNSTRSSTDTLTNESVEDEPVKDTSEPQKEEKDHSPPTSPNLGIFTNSPFLTYSPTTPTNSGTKRVIFQLPTTHKDSDVEDSLQTIIPVIENGSVTEDEKTEFENKHLSNGVPSPDDTVFLLRKSKETSEEVKEVQKRPHSNIVSPPTVPLDSPITRPKTINSKTQIVKRHTISTPSPSAGANPISGPPMLRPVRPQRMSELLQQKAKNASSPRGKRRSSEGREGESDDSYFSDSDFDDDEYSDVQHLDDDGMSQTSDFTSYSDETIPRSPADRDPCYDVALELLKTERAYLDRLHFLCRVVLLNVRILNKVQEQFVIPCEALVTIFNNVEDIYNLHTATVLPRVEARVDNWRTTPQLGGLMKELMPQLKVYTEYVEHFDNAMTAMTIWTERCPIFRQLIVEVEKTPECRRLKVKQHMLEVVQRIPKYLMLLKDYAGHLAEDSDDKQDTMDTLSALSEFSQNLERAQGKDGRMRALLSVQQRLDAPSLKVYSPLRELVKESKIKSISPKTAKKLDRYIFLMNDVLLICTTQSLAGRHKLKYTLDIDGLQVYDGDNLVIPFTFYVQNKTKAIEFHCNTMEDKLEWMSIIQTTIDKSTENKLMHQPISHNTKTLKDEEIGKVKPKLVKPEGKPVCSICRTSMKKASFCKGCGAVVCSKCSSQKIRLDYDNKHKSRVCDECYILLIHRDLSDEQQDIPDVRPSDPCQLAGYLQININKSQTWKKRWLTIHDNGVLYSFKNFKEQTVLGCLQLKRYAAQATVKGDDVFKPNTLKLYNARRTYFLQADNTDAMSRWLDAFAEFTNSIA